MKSTIGSATVIFLLALAPGGFAQAQDAASQNQTPQDLAALIAALKRYGATHKTCDGWSDGCALCARRPDGTLGCSRLGVDCQVSEIQCTQLARDPKTGKTPPPR